MAQQSRVLAALAEVLGLVPCSHMAAQQPPVTPSPWNPMPSLDSWKAGIDVPTDPTSAHIHINFNDLC